MDPVNPTNSLPGSDNSTVILILVLLIVLLILVLIGFGLFVACRYCCKVLSKENTIRISGSGHSQESLRSTANMSRFTGEGRVRVIKKSNKKYALIPLDSDDVKQKGRTGRRGGSKGDMVSTSSQTDFGYESDPGRSVISELALDLNGRACISAADRLSPVSMIIGESNPHDINTRHCSLPGLAGAVEDQDGMEEGSNQTTECPARRLDLKCNAIKQFGEISKENSENSGSSGSVGGRPRNRTVTAELETSEDFDFSDRTPSEEVREMTQIHLQQIAGQKQDVNNRQTRGNANSGTRIRDQGAVGLPPSSQMSAGSNMSVCGSDPVVTDDETKEWESIYRKLKEIDWVFSYYSEGQSIEVYVNSETYEKYENPRQIELLLAGMTGADSTQFHVRY